MRVLRAIPAFFVLILVACGIGNVNISISPDKATVEVGSQTQFSASVGNAGNKLVTWSATGGTVDSTGLYTAPGSAGTSYVVATSQADPSRTATAVITVVAPVVITPTSVTLAPGGKQTFTAIIPATGDTNVTWNITEAPKGGTITDGNYTAPSDADDTAVFHIVASSVADSSKTGTALVTIQTPVTISPLSASIKVSTQQQFTATVRANPGTSVTWTWTVLENAAGGTAGGTIDNNGLYTAPTSTGPYHVVATNPLDTNQTGRATVTVTP